ncbi:8774_t:CDS:2, partial [Racocetra persica]
AYTVLNNPGFTEEEKATLLSYFAKNDDLLNSASTVLRLCTTDDEKCAYLRSLIFEYEEKMAIRTYFTKNYALVSSANAILRSCSTEKEKCDYLKNLISES